MYRQCHFRFASPTSVCEYVKFTGSDDGYKTIGPAEPTSAVPGSKLKLAVLAKRLGEGRELWHDNDVVLEDHLRKLLEAIECTRE